ncbi:MAG TPA: protein kinase [Thermoanaerobaculia bacterium]|nr:protein kinase [Thermoanaerobaculia bacterium]
MIGETISHYDVIELLDRGEAGLVYKARDRRDDSLVAIELLPVPPDSASGDRLRQEAETASALGHPHISPVLEVGEVLGRGLFVARRLEGETLRTRLERCPLAPEQALGVASQIAAALGRAHEQGLVHRDLRPSNVLVTSEGQVRVAGFGLSWARGIGGIGGIAANSSGGSASSLLYQSPEQLRGTSADAVDARSDIWSLGVLLYEMTTGRLPFPDAESILEREPEPMDAIHPGLPPELDGVVARVLSKEPSERPARMDDLLVSLRGLLAGGGLLETDATLVQVPGLRSGRPEPEPGSLDKEGAGPAEHTNLAALPGTAIAQYRILEPLGGGAMGTVYEAEDTRLRRRVALKFLPDELTRDPVAKARFLQEAQAASALDHPNICTVHEVGETEDGHLYLAMAAYDGETVKERIARSPLSVDEALDIACQAAQGLAKAHREGIVHRDVKPANLMVTRDGMVKILDFGVAKLRGAAGINVVGSFLGTPAYMSPEQARGEEVDPRSDVFSLGVVLYEMLAGARPFRSGEGVTSALRSLLEDKPAPLRSVRPEVPMELERVALRMLAKPPADRFPTGAEVAAELTDIQKSLAEPAPVRAASRRTWFAAAAILGVVLVLVAVALLRRSEPAPVQPVFSRVTEEEGRELYPSLAPDGRSFAYAKADLAGQKDILLQKIGVEGDPLNVTEGSEADDSQPAISPDGRWIAFRSEREGGGIYIASVEGGPARRIAEVGYSPAWSPDGRELAVATEPIIDPAMRKDVSEILRVDVATGRSRVIVGDIDKSGDDGVQPSWSPHGWRIAYWGVPTGSARRILWTVPAEGGEPRKVLDDGFVNWNPVWSPDGAWLYFGSDRSGSLNLWRLQIDERSGEVRGDPQPVTTPSTASGFWSLSKDGSRILYAANESKSNVERFPFDPVGLQVTGPVEAVTRGSHIIRSCAVSPDGSRIAFHAALPGEELFVAAIDGSGFRQLTADKFNDRQPAWSPDGRRLLFYSNRGGGYEAWIVNAKGGEPQRVLPQGGQPVTVPIWSPDGRRVACTYGGKAAVIDLTRPLQARRAELLPAASGETFYPSSWSADGQGLAGNMARLDGSTAEGIGLHLLGSSTYLRWTSRGFNPEWLHDGRRLLYLEAGKILAFDTQTSEARDVLVPPPYSAYELVTISPDDRSLFAVRAVDEGDIWLLTLRNQRGDAPEQEEKR